MSSNIFRIQFMFDEKKKLSINSTSSFTLTGWREERGESECAGFDLSPIGNLNSIFFRFSRPAFRVFNQKKRERDVNCVNIEECGELD